MISDTNGTADVEVGAASDEPAPTLPKSPFTRERADTVGRAMMTGARAGARAVAAVAAFGVNVVRGTGRAIAAVPPAVRGFGLSAVGMLLGVVGAVTLANTVGLLCTVVLIPICAGALGAMAQRWYSGLGATARPRAEMRTAEIPAAKPTASDLQRSVEYVDNKLAVALTSLGTERHQQAVVALFQAKTAVELTLGTEQESPDYDVALRSADYGLAPRPMVGSNPPSALTGT